MLCKFLTVSAIKFHFIQSLLFYLFEFNSITRQYEMEIIPFSSVFTIPQFYSPYSKSFTFTRFLTF